MDKRSNNGGKIILGMLKGKSATTSVPSMAIRFNASAEEIEEIFTNEEEQNDHVNDSALPIEKSNELETSPRRSILPILGKRSTSIDINSTNAQDSSPPSDPWRFLSDIKGKITKSVEVKFTEYKSRTQDGDGSPKIVKPVKDNVENSSLSDSEEASESSISKTCGLASTTEGAEMSSDDETSSSEEEKVQHLDDEAQGCSANPCAAGLRQRVRVQGSDTRIKEATVSTDFLDTIQQLTHGIDGIEEDEQEIEDGVDALADLNVSNFEMDEERVLNIKAVSGTDIVSEDQTGGTRLRNIFSPVGFVDLRSTDVEPGDLRWSIIDFVYGLRAVFFTFFGLCLYFCFPFSLYVNGFIAGVMVASAVWALYVKVCLEQSFIGLPGHIITKAAVLTRRLTLVPLSVEEHKPLTKYEGWVNEYPQEYNPLTYHVSQTQSVYLRLQGNFLKVSHTRQKIPKRAMWHEPDHKLVFTRNRIYNLLGAKVLLLPKGLAKVRHWSKKYPICIILHRDQQVNEQHPTKKTKESRSKTIKKGVSAVEMQMFSKLVQSAEEQERLPNVASSASVPPELDDSVSVDISAEETSEDVATVDTLLEDDDEDSVNITDWHTVASESFQKKSPDDTYIYIFGRTGREKEDWFRRLRMASNTSMSQQSDVPVFDEYVSFMRSHNIHFNTSLFSNIRHIHGENVWVNALLARIVFDCVREQLTIQRLRVRIQRKLSTIRLPYFIQEIHCEELTLGSTAPSIVGNSAPILNDRGLWIDLDVHYEGLVVLILQTKVNLLKLKHQHTTNVMPEKLSAKPAMFDSDVDDSAESTTDEESSPVKQGPVLDSKGIPVPGLGGQSRGNKKFLRIVDRIAESKFFQAATENKYIKKAMEEFSNTSLRLRVEVRKCAGKLALNIPAPPSDRIWLGFREPPELHISAHPIVGERNISLMRVTSWIEKKIYKEFQKIFVIPNMEDVSIPVMCSRLPE